MGYFFMFLEMNDLRCPKAEILILDINLKFQINKFQNYGKKIK